MESKLSRVNAVHECKWKKKVKEHWQGVLTHNITVLRCLFKHCPAFHGTSVGLYVQGSGCFLGLMC